MTVAGVRPQNRAIDVTAALLSCVVGLFMGLVLFSQVALFIVPLAPVGIYVGLRGLRVTRGAVRGFAWAGVVLNSLVVGVFVFTAVRYLID